MPCPGTGHHGRPILPPGQRNEPRALSGRRPFQAAPRGERQLGIGMQGDVSRLRFHDGLGRVGRVPAGNPAAVLGIRGCRNQIPAQGVGRLAVAAFRGFDVYPFSGEPVIGRFQILPPGSRGRLRVKIRRFIPKKQLDGRLILRCRIGLRRCSPTRTYPARPAAARKIRPAPQRRPTASKA